MPRSELTATDSGRASVKLALEALRNGETAMRAVARAGEFGSVGELRAACVAKLGLTPEAWLKLGQANRFSLELPRGFVSDDVFGLFGRDADGRTERVEGQTLTKAMLLLNRPARVEMRFDSRCLEVAIGARRSPNEAMMREAHAKVVRMLGLNCDPVLFEERISSDPKLADLISGRKGLRIPQTIDVYEALVWVIVGQQVNLKFAGTCRSRLIELCGRDAGAEFVAHPTPEEVAKLEYKDLVKLQFSRRKAEYMIDTSRLIASGELRLDDLEELSDASILARLSKVRGLGPWSINYLLLRALGRPDCVPVGDAGLVVALQRFFGLAERPDAKETLRLMEPFAPHRSLASFHFWKSLEGPV